MLVLTRKIEQEIQIGQNITIKILKVKGRSVQIGIEAPGEVRILRGEFAGSPKTPQVNEVDPPAADASLPDGLGDSDEGAEGVPQSGPHRIEVTPGGGRQTTAASRPPCSLVSRRRAPRRSSAPLEDPHRGVGPAFPGGRRPGTVRGLPQIPRCG